MLSLLRFLAISLFITCHAHAVLNLSEQTVSTDITPLLQQVSFSENKTLRDVYLANNWDDFKASSQHKYVWARIDLRYEGEGTQEWYVSLTNLNLPEVDIFLLDEMGRIVTSEQLGNRRASGKLKHFYREFVSSVNLSPSRQYSLYMKFHDPQGVRFSASMSLPHKYQSTHQGFLLANAMMAGALLILFMYFLVTYLVLHRPIRFWFASACSGFLVIYLVMSGLFSSMFDLSFNLQIVSSVFIIGVYFSLAKTANLVLPQHLALYRLTNYGFAIFMLIVLLAKPSWAVACILALSGMYILLLLAMAHVRKVAKLNSPIFYFVASLVSIFAIGTLDLVAYSMWGWVSHWFTLFINVSMLLSIICVAVSIEAQEKVKV